MSMGIEIANRKRFHLFKQIVPQIAHGSLADIYHNPIVSKSRDYAYSHDARQPDQVRSKPVKIVSAGLQHRDDIVVYQRLRKSGADNRGGSRDQNADDHKQKRIFIIVKHISDHAADQFHSRIFSRSCLFLVVLFIHRLFLPSDLRRLVEISAAFKL